MTTRTVRIEVRGPSPLRDVKSRIDEIHAVLNKNSFIEPMIDSKRAPFGLLGDSILNSKTVGQLVSGGESKELPGLPVTNPQRVISRPHGTPSSLLRTEAVIGLSIEQQARERLQRRKMYHRNCQETNCQGPKQSSETLCGVQAPYTPYKIQVDQLRPNSRRVRTIDRVCPSNRAPTIDRVSSLSTSSTSSQPPRSVGSGPRTRVKSSPESANVSSSSTSSRTGAGVRPCPESADAHVTSSGPGSGLCPSSLQTLEEDQATLVDRVSPSRPSHQSGGINPSLLEPQRVASPGRSGLERLIAETQQLLDQEIGAIDSDQIWADEDIVAEIERDIDHLKFELRKNYR